MATAGISRICRSILLTITIFSISLPACAQYSGGTGEPNDPYQIATAADLIALGETPDHYDKHFILTADIDLDPNLPGGKVFERAVIAPVTDDTKFGLQGTQFTGVFDGSGHTISNLTIKGKEFLGLFGTLGWFARPVGEVRNLRLVDVNITGSGSFVGGLVAHTYPGIVMYCSSSGTVRGDQYVGGLVGANDGNITACSSGGAVSGDQYVGGLVGYSRQGLVSQCRSASTVNGNSSVGGLVGLLLQSTIRQCYSCGLVSGVDGVGGVVGTYGGGHVARSFWDIETSGQTRSAGGTGKTTAEMQTASTFLDAGWDFVGETANGTEEIWKIAEGMGYPRLAWEKYSGGTGEPNDPYQIATVADLIALGEDPNDYDKHFILTADIDLDPNLPSRKVFDRAVIAPDVNDASWEYDGTPFAGVFDGGGHVISHLAIQGGGNLGLFGSLTGEAQVSNVGMVDANITGSGWYVGGVAGRNQGSISNSYSTGAVSGTWSVGGLAGYNAGSGSISNSYSTGAVSGTIEQDGNVGGLVGRNEGAVTQCHSTGAVSGTGSFAGGLVGRNYGGHVTQCCSTGTVTGNDTVGGLVGENWYPGTVTQCYSTGAVSGTGNYVGGLVACNDGTVTLCYSTGRVSGENEVGGLFGRNDCGIVNFNFWDTQTSGQAWSAGGTGKTTAEMKMARTFVAWGACGPFWTINETLDYPHLAWEGMPGDLIDATFGGGTGIAEDPYLIYTPEQLNTIGLARCAWDKHFKLMADIDLSGYDGKEGRAAFNAIGDYLMWDEGEEPTSYSPGLPFTGVFDGNGHTISHLTIEGETCVAMFAYLASGAEIKNLGVVDVNVTGTGAVAGGLVAYNERGSVTRCYSTGVVSGAYYVGGLLGCNAGTVIDSYATAKVVGDRLIGGLVGANGYWRETMAGAFWVPGAMCNCYSTGAVIAGGNGGGLVGRGHVYYYRTLPDSASATVTSSFWDAQASGQATSAGGTGKTTAEMQTAKTFLDAGWDFVGETANGTEDIWWILEGQDYPRLWWEASD